MKTKNKKEMYKILQKQPYYKELVKEHERQKGKKDLLETLLKTDIKDWIVRTIHWSESEKGSGYWAIVYDGFLFVYIVYQRKAIINLLKKQPFYKEFKKEFRKQHVGLSLKKLLANIEYAEDVIVNDINWVHSKKGVAYWSKANDKFQSKIKKRGLSLY